MRGQSPGKAKENAICFNICRSSRTAMRVHANLRLQPTSGSRVHFLLNAVAREETLRQPSLSQ